MNTQIHCIKALWNLKYNAYNDDDDDDYRL